MKQIKKLLYLIFNFILRYSDKQYELYLLYKFGFIDKHLEPLKCNNCGSKEFDDVIIDKIDYRPVEVQRQCACCHMWVGYWAYGYWMP